MLCCLKNVLPNSITFYVGIVIVGIIYLIRFMNKSKRAKLDITNEINISGKTVIVTGASDGIGVSTAEEFAIRGARVIMACRNLAKAEKAKAKIRTRTSSGELIIMKLDLASLTSVHNFAAEFIAKYGDQGLSILVNNAGIVATTGKIILTEDGFEQCFGVNHLAHFLLTNLLLPQLEKAGRHSSYPSRVIIVSSTSHLDGQLDFDDLLYEKKPFEDYKLLSKLYCNSKLANNLFNIELARRIRARQAAGEQINVNSYALCPGMVATNALRNTVAGNPLQFVLRYLIPLMGPLISLNPNEGAETTMYCALSKYLVHHSGEMYRHNRFWDYSERIKLSEEDAKLLWKKSEEFVKLN